jgi:hypothetical protein
MKASREKGSMLDGDELKSDVRNFPRLSVRTVVTVIAEDGDGTRRAYKTWTDDLSASGVKLLSDMEIPANEVTLKLAMPGLSDRYFTGRIVRRQKSDELDMRRGDVKRFVYGVEFRSEC